MDSNKSFADKLSDLISKSIDECYSLSSLMVYNRIDGKMVHISVRMNDIRISIGFSSLSLHNMFSNETILRIKIRDIDRNSIVKDVSNFIQKNKHLLEIYDKEITNE